MQHKMLQNELRVLQRRKVPDTDPRIIAINRILEKQKPEVRPRHKDNIPFSQFKEYPRGR